MLNLLLAMSIGSAFGATSISHPQPETSSAFAATNVSSHRLETSSAFAATNVSSHRPETITKSMTRSGDGAVPTNGTVQPLSSTSGSFYQNVSATGLLKGGIRLSTDQETQM